MKKLFVFILLLVYFTVNTGFVVSLHYCMDKRASVDLGSRAKEKCDKCGMPSRNQKDCCHDEIKVVKLNADEVQAYSLAYQPIQFPDVFPLSLFIDAPLQKRLLSISNKAHAPPLIHKQDIYLTNCVFRI